tara:strand:+ start:129 stop:1652 length:1524 start_codon:yes stop_codon:yes gene_type:complete
MKNKIYSLKKLSEIIKKDKKRKKKIILCHGVFDLLHIGHIKHLKKAKTFADKLIVTITSDQFVNKGPGRPVFNQYLRSQAIAAIEDVDYVAINENSTAVNLLKLLKPNFYCKGKEYNNLKNDVSGEIKNEIKELKKNKGKIIFTEEVTFSSSRIINTSTDFFSPLQKKKISKIKKKTNFNLIKKTIDNFKKLKILVVGETIIDQYTFCETLGKSGKEPMLVLRELKKEQYLGGVLSIARNLFNLSNNIDVISMVGEKSEYLKDIKKVLSNKIKANFVTKKNSPTIVKKRFVDSINQTKVIGVYDINDEELNQKDEKKFYSLIKKNIKKYDLVIVSDYGHGLISKRTAKMLCSNSKFLSLNAQINASNIGYHTLRNYNNFDTLIINEKELRHEMRDKRSKTETLMSHLASEKKIKNLIVTIGEKGSILFNKSSNKYYYSEAYAEKIIDKIGAGDTMLSVIGPCIKSNMDFDISLLVSSLAAAQSVESMGNKNSINKIKILKTLENILK